MNVSFKGYNEKCVTFEADTTVTAPLTPVKITADGKVSACADGDEFCGVAINTDGGYASVALSGYVELPVSGAVAHGFQPLAAAAGGKIKSDAAKGRKLLVVYSSGGVAGFIL